MPEILAQDIGLSLPIFSGDFKPTESVETRKEERFVLTQSGRPKAIRVLAGINLDLKTGDRLGIVGKNGSGKSTLLRVLGGILSPTEGKLDTVGTVRGIYNLSLGLKPDATGYRNIILIGLIAGLRKKEIEALLPGIAEFSGLGEFLSLPVSTYSSGMRMRLLFATMTSFGPDILVLDEWLGAGDVAFREKASRRMQELVAEAGIMVLASHNLQLLKNNCNKCIWLDDGRIIMEGDTVEVVDAYHRKLTETNQQAMAQSRQAATAGNAPVSSDDGS